MFLSYFCDDGGRRGFVYRAPPADQAHDEGSDTTGRAGGLSEP